MDKSQLLQKFKQIKYFRLALTLKSDFKKTVKIKYICLEKLPNLKILNVRSCQIL